MTPARASLATTLDDGHVRCGVCPHQCVIREGGVGTCGIRGVRGGTLELLTYGRPVAVHVDPIEKKPLFHLLPGAGALSLATVGCNLRCTFCQNHSISQASPGEPLEDEVSPEAVVDAAERQGARVVAYTYTEPFVFLEYCLDIMAVARARGLLNVFVTNGFASPEAVALVLPLLDGANVDLKAFSDQTYRRYTGGRLEPVLDTIRAFVAGGVVTEVTTLVVPGLNDSDDELRSIASFVASTSPSVPWHVSRFHPTYRMVDRPSTPAETLARARDIGHEEGLRYVYVGNLPGRGGEDTVCHQCGATVIGRWGFSVETKAMSGGACAACGAPVYGRFEAP